MNAQPRQQPAVADRPLARPLRRLRHALVGDAPYTLLALLILGLAAALRTVGLDKGIWLDEYSSLSVTLFSGGDLLGALRSYDHPPTYYLLLALWAQLGTAEPFLRVPSLAFGLLSVAAALLWLRPLSRAASLLIGLMIATLPILVRYSQEIRGYGLLVLATVVAFFAASRLAAGRGRLWYVILAAALCVAVTSHLIGIMVLPSLCVYLLPAYLRGRPRAEWARLAAAIVAPALLFALVLLGFMRRADTAGWWVPPITADHLRSTFSYTFGLQALAAPGFTLARPSLLWGYEVTLTLGLAALGAALLAFGDWRRTWPLLAAAAVFWLEVILFSLLFVPVFMYRTALPGLVPLLAFVALQAASIRARAVRAAVIAGLAALSLLYAGGWLLTEARTPWEPWREVARTLAAEYRPGDVVVFYPSYIEGPARYYLTPPLPEQLIALRPEAEAAELQGALAALPAAPVGSEPTLFFVVQADLSVQQDPRFYAGLLAYLNEVARPVGEPLDLARLRIYRYRMASGE